MFSVTRRAGRRAAAAVVAAPSPFPSPPVPRRTMSSAWDAQPAPPRLPPDQQAEFDRLVKEAQESAAAASLADALAAANEAAEAKAAAEVAAVAAVAVPAEEPVAAATTTTQSTSTKSATAGLDGNPIEGVWRGAPAEFTGDRNPKTGEVGGPKNEPLRWGSAGDWSYNGRVTDF